MDGRWFGLSSSIFADKRLLPPEFCQEKDVRSSLGQLCWPEGSGRGCGADSWRLEGNRELLGRLRMKRWLVVVGNVKKISDVGAVSANGNETRKAVNR